YLDSRVGYLSYWRLVEHAIGLESNHEHWPRPASRSPVDAQRAGYPAQRALGHGGAGAVRYRQGPQQDERQKLDQAAGTWQPTSPAVPVGGDPYRLEECAQGRRFLSGWRAAGLAWLYWRGTGHGDCAGAGLGGQPGAA